MILFKEKPFSVNIWVLDQNFNDFFSQNGTIYKVISSHNQWAFIWMTASSFNNSIFSGYGGYGGYGVSKVVTPAVASVAAPIYGGYGSYGGYGGYGVSKVVSPVATLGMHVWYRFFPFTHSSNNSRNSNYSSLQVISRTYSCVFCIVQFIARVHRISKNASKFYSAKEINKKRCEFVCFNEFGTEKPQKKTTLKQVCFNLRLSPVNWCSETKKIFHIYFLASIQLKFTLSLFRQVNDQFTAFYYASAFSHFTSYDTAQWIKQIFFLTIAPFLFGHLKISRTPFERIVHDLKINLIVPLLLQVLAMLHQLLLSSKFCLCSLKRMFQLLTLAKYLV